MTADWSAAYTPNAGPMDAVIKVQLNDERRQSAQEYVRAAPRRASPPIRRFGDLEFAFDAGGMIRGAMNEGKSTPLNVRITAHDLATARQVAEKIQREVAKVDGIVDARILQRLDYPEYIIDVDRTKAADLGLNQDDVMKNVVAALNSSIQFNKRNFWIDPDQPEPVLRRRAVSRERHQVDRHAAGHPHHQPRAEAAHPAEEHRLAAARRPCPPKSRTRTCRPRST